MQSTVDLQLTKGHLEKLRGKHTFIELLSEFLTDNREKIGYSIQDYHAREKVRVVDLTGIAALGDDTYKATVRYTLEEFSVCAAIDVTDYTSMELTIHYDERSNVLRITGEYAPEA